MIELICNQCNKKIIRKSVNTKSINHFCALMCKAEWQKDQRRKKGFTKEWIYNQYWILGKSSDQIAKELKKDPKTVWNWFKVENIPTRPRGTDYGQCFQKGKESFFKGKKHTIENKEKQRQRRLKDGHVPYLKNGIHWLKHEGAISPTYKGGITPDRQSFYSSIEWITAVKKVWKRDNAICQRCSEKHNDKDNRGTFHIHHIESFLNKEKRSNVDNLILLCRSCHLWVHSKKNINKEFIK